MRENTLCLLATGHGPWTAVRKGRAIRAHGLQQGDKFCILSHATGEKVCTIEKDGRHEVEIPEGHIKVERLQGETPITVFVEGE